MMNLRCLIVDDDPMSRKLLEHHCMRNDSLELIAICENVETALETLKNSPIDIIFLDIEMPGSNGFELLEQCSVIPFVIVISSKKEYAFEAFQYQVIDYLQKPVTIPRFQQAIGKVMSQMNSTAVHESVESSNIFIKSDGRLVKIELEDLLYVENVGDYVKFHTVQGKVIAYSTLKRLEEKLDEGFLKVHRSFIINLSKIKDIEENTIVIGDKVIPISRAHKKTLLDKLNLI